MFCFKQLPITVWRYVFVADLEALSCQVTRKFIRCRNAETRTISAINIPPVCALHEQCTHHRRSVKMSKIQIFFKIPIVRGYIFFQRVQIPYASRYIGKALLSRKLVVGDDSSEGSETANSGTDTSTSSAQAKTGTVYEAYLFGVSKHTIVTP